MKRGTNARKACANCGLEAAVAKKICAGCNTPFITRRAMYYEGDSSCEVSSTTAAAAQAQQQPSQPVQVQDVPGPSSLSDDNTRRRTERVKRTKPSYYDASEFVKKTKKRKYERNATKPVNIKANKAYVAAQVKKQERKRMMELKRREAMLIAEDEFIYDSVVGPRNTERMSAILDELNKKFCVTTFRT